MAKNSSTTTVNNFLEENHKNYLDNVKKQEEKLFEETKNIIIENAMKRMNGQDNATLGIKKLNNSFEVSHIATIKNKEDYFLKIVPLSQHHHQLTSSMQKISKQKLIELAREQIFNDLIDESTKYSTDSRQERRSFLEKFILLSIQDQEKIVMAKSLQQESFLKNIQISLANLKNDPQQSEVIKNSYKNSLEMIIKIQPSIHAEIKNIETEKAQIKATEEQKMIANLPNRENLIEKYAELGIREKNNLSPSMLTSITKKANSNNYSIMIESAHGTEATITYEINHSKIEELAREAIFAELQKTSYPAGKEMNADKREFLDKFCILDLKQQQSIMKAQPQRRESILRGIKELDLENSPQKPTPTIKLKH